MAINKNMSSHLCTRCPLSFYFPLFSFCNAICDRNVPFQKRKHGDSGDRAAMIFLLRIFNHS